MKIPALATVAALLPLLVPADAAAQSYRCVGKDGKKYYGQSVPPQCVGLPVEQLNAQGLVIKRFDAQASADERAKKEADEVERKKREAISKEEGRRNRALLATYTSEKDIDDARARALKDNEAAMKEVERRIAGLRQKIADTRKEMKDTEAKKQPTAKLEQTITNTEFDIKTQEDLLAAKKKEVSVINARYDDDKRRYVELTKGATRK